jgi:integrase
MEQMYKVFSNYVERLPTYDLDRAGEIFNWITRKIPADSAKRFLTRLSACCKWAMQSGLIDKNPFDGLAAQIVLPKGSKGDQIDPFTAAERDRICEALKTNVLSSKFARIKHSHYWPYIYFAFYTGARTSEIVALQWRHIELDANPSAGQTAFGRIRFEDSVVESRDGRVRKKGLKTQERRIFPINRQLYDFLVDLRPDGVKSSDLVFSAPNGGWLHASNFSIRVWKPLLEGLGVRYRKVYACRHTFITLTLQAGIPIPDIARLVGNSPEVILKHYAGHQRSLVVPEL